MTDRKTTDNGNIENNTGTELEILASIERSFFNANPNARRRNTARSLEWFSKALPRNYNNVRTARMLRDRDLWADKIVPGRMYLFNYDARHKATLPVWDRWPLIFPWDVWQGGDGKYGESGVTYFIGINLHFLPPRLRLIAMKTLLTTRNEKRYRRSTRLKISWQVLKGLSNSKFFEHSVKIYRMDHVRSKFIHIPPQSWELVTFLPLARFEGDKAKAWKI